MTFRNATREEVDVVLGWAGDEGWNPGLSDADAFFAADPDGFFVAETDGTLSASISVVNHTDDFAFLGLYICRPEFRGRGIGYGLWEHAIAHAGARTIGLDGVPDQQENYAASGFVWAGETRRFEGQIAGVSQASVREVVASDIVPLIRREAEVTGVAKVGFNAVWLAGASDRTSFVLEDSASFATARSCRSGTKIGPLVAETMDQARTLIHHIAAQFDSPLILDVPTGSESLAKWCEGEGMEVSFGTARMYRGVAPVTSPAVLAVSTLELG